jgi:hypothetical protein
MTPTKDPSVFGHRALEVKQWLQRPPTVEAARPGRCPRCGAASRPEGKSLGIYGHGVRDRQVRGPLEITAAPTVTVIGCRRYLCLACGAVILVVPRGIEPRRHFGRAAICLALALWAVDRAPTPAVRRRVSPWRSSAMTWRAPRAWAQAIAAGAWAWCRAAAGRAPHQAAARAAQIAAGRAPPLTSGPFAERAYAGGAALA